MKKKIVFIAESLYGGGVERILQIVLSHFNYNRYDVTLFTVRKNVIDAKIFPAGIKYKYIFDIPKDESSILHKVLCKVENKAKLFIYYHCNSKLFYRLFLREKADVAIAFIEGYATRLVSGFPNNTRKIAWIHTDIEKNHWSKVAFRSQKEEKTVYQYSFDKIVCVSKVVQEKLLKFSKNISNTLVLYNPIDKQHIQTSSKKEIDLFKYKKSGPLIISLGSLIDVKGYDRLLAVASRLLDSGFMFNLIILGDGIKKEELNTYIVNNKLSLHVFLLGYQENPYPFLRQSDIYVCSSYAEGYNTAITEALVLGKPVVSTECSGVKEQLGENNEWGICVPNSEDGLYDGLKQMLKPDTLVHYTQQASIRGKYFALDKSMNEIYHLLES